MNWTDIKNSSCDARNGLKCQDQENDSGLCKLKKNCPLFNKNSSTKLLQLAISKAIEFELSWLHAMKKCNHDDDLQAKKASKKFIRELKNYHKKRWGYLP